jgi:hypothetical protein
MTVARNAGQHFGALFNMPRMTSAEFALYEARRQPRQIPAGNRSETREDVLHDEILNECKRRGWIALHGRMDMATGRTVGEPDFTILAEGRVLFVEAKTAGGKLRPEQAALIAWARKLGHTVHVIRSIQEFMEITK